MLQSQLHLAVSDLVLLTYSCPHFRARPKLLLLIVVEERVKD